MTEHDITQTPALSPQIADTDAPEQPDLDPGKLTYYVEKLRLEQNLLGGVLAASGAALLGAGIWAAITVSTEFQIGWMAVGVGFLVGIAMRAVGKGIDKVFGIVGAVLALVGCLLGNFFSICGFIANQQGLAFLEVLGVMEPALVGELMVATLHPMDFLFYGIAIYEGYKFSFRQITEDEVVAAAAVSS